MDVTDQENVLNKFLIFDFHAFFEGDVFFLLICLKMFIPKRLVVIFSVKEQ